ncbi:DUF2254 domain-containing protein [Halomonas daqiaonensis]|uniref:Uncharacterized membrane protein n=1 Tax=Halomonas daqiaonensis TaxID=650850 RepID=A0A1H7M470_9GAMM|nr:DUF2254 domain-containing protein [Halomonas daqiaonensis]SEL06003.1 Uncharacterized membrane protein [Halomonas daqiaonensis]
MRAFLSWPIHLLKAYRQSIAYLPSLLALAYAFLSLIALLLPISDDRLPTLLTMLGLEAPEDTLPLLVALLGGMISLMVFSFSMVMSVLSQAGGQFSHKLVFGLISERPHQWVLGHYLGTILFILMLMMVPNVADGQATWRSLAIYLACAMVIHCLALFVYFIHKASQSIQIDAVVTDLHQSTLASMQVLQSQQQGQEWRILAVAASSGHRHYPVHARRAGYLQNADLSALAALAHRVDGVVHLHFRFGDYVVKGLPILSLEAASPPEASWCDEVRATLTYVEGESITEHHVFGLTQLMEVAVKALSPGINDPGTARLCLHRLTDLLGRRLEWQPCNSLFDRDGTCRLTWKVEDFESLLYRLFQPILRYGREDLSIGLGVLKALKTLSLFAEEKDLETLQAHADRVVETLSQAADHPLDRRFVSARLDDGIHRLTLPRVLPGRQDT